MHTALSVKTMDREAEAIPRTKSEASAPLEGSERRLASIDSLLPAGHSRREEDADRQLFLQAVWTDLVLLDPSFFGVGFEGRRNFTLKRPEIGRQLIDGDFPVISSVPDVGCDQLVDRLHPPFPEDGTRQGPGHVVELETNEFAVRYATDIDRLGGDFLKDHHDVKFRDRNP